MNRHNLIKFAIRLGIKEGRLHTRRRIHNAIRRDNMRHIWKSVFQQGFHGCDRDL